MTRFFRFIWLQVTSASKKKVCFAMFVDQPSLDGMIEEGESPDENMNLGLWRIVLIKNAPYSDNRRTGKVPKFLTHRLFPNARYRFLRSLSHGKVSLLQF